MEVTSVRMKKERTKGGTRRKSGLEERNTEGEEGGSWDSWDTGEGCRPIKMVS